MRPSSFGIADCAASPELATLARDELSGRVADPTSRESVE
jgi:hypothetical protein